MNIESIPENLRIKLRNIRALLLDVDGVLTDGSITYSDSTVETKSFHVRDGYGITQAIQQGLLIGIITGRSSEIVLRRARELGITDIYQGVMEKINAYKEFKTLYDLSDENVAYIGDDEPDIPVLRAVRFSASPSDAHASVQSVVDYITTNRGGKGAVREVIDMILSCRDTP